MDVLIRKQKQKICNQARCKLSDRKACLENNRSIFKYQSKFWSEAHSVFTETIGMVTLNANDDNII